mgnify:CR=1 FL=1
MNVTYIVRKKKPTTPRFETAIPLLNLIFFPQTFLVIASVTFTHGFHQQREHEQRQNAQPK